MDGWKDKQTRHTNLIFYDKVCNVYLYCMLTFLYSPLNSMGY